MNWSVTTNSPSPISALSEPDALGPMIRRTPSSFIAQTFARYGICAGGSSWFGPWRGRNATLRPPISPIVNGPDGFPYGVSTSTVSTSSRNE